MARNVKSPAAVGKTGERSIPTFEDVDTSEGDEMSFREKSAWVMVASLVGCYGWYLTTLLAQLSEGSVAAIAYQRTAVMAAIAVIVLAAVSNGLLAATARPEQRHDRLGTTAIKRYARSAGGTVVTVAAVLGMTLAMAEVDDFWVANVILAGLVVAELASAGSEIRIYRRRT